MDNELKEWIENATYSQLLHRWRFGGEDDPMFKGELGSFYKTVMEEKRQQLSEQMQVEISKTIGWEQ